jgi:hypothetical protein
LNTNIVAQKTHVDSPKTLKKYVKYLFYYIPAVILFKKNNRIGSNTSVQTNGVHTNSNGSSPTSMIPNTNGTSSSTSSSNDINNDRLKQEILVEIRKEMQVMKNDIITGNLKFFVGLSERY